MIKGFENGNCSCPTRQTKCKQSNILSRNELWELEHSSSLTQGVNNWLQTVAIKLLRGNLARHPTIRDPSWITFMLVIHLVPPVYNSNTITREFIQRPEADQKNDSRRSRRSMYSDIIVVSGKSTGTIRNPPKQAPPNYKRINNTIDLYLKILPFHR